MSAILKKLPSKKYTLMSLGPMQVSPRVSMALTYPPICHRENDFSELLQRVRQKLLGIYCGGTNSRVVVFTGSGTASLEATISSVVRGGSMLVLTNGYYGEQLARIAKVHGIKIEVLRYHWGQRLNIQDAERLLRKKGIEFVAMVHHEVSTGMLNQIDEIGDLAFEHEKTFIVDAVGSFGLENLDVEEFHIDYCIAAHKGAIEAIPGISFVCANKEKLESLKGIPPRTYYLDLYKQYYNEEYLGQTPFTPALPLFYALEVALDELLAEGVENRRNIYALRAQMIRKALTDFGFKLFLPVQFCSNLLTAAWLPENLTYETLHDRLKEKGFVIYAGQGSLEQKIFRVANMGRITIEEIHNFIKALEAVLEGIKDVVPTPLVQ